MVILLGNRTDVYRLYWAMDVFVLPSRYEGLPVVGVEAQTSGTPCVFSDAMTAETKMAKNTIMLSLDESAKIWAKKVLEFSKLSKYDSSAEIQVAGFDIACEREKLERYYTRRSFMKEKKEQRIQDNILFLGNRNDVYRLYQAMDVFVFPSHYEGLGMVVVEAQTAGLPCVVSDVVPSEAKILEGTEMLDLEKPEEWAEQMLEVVRLPKRDTTEAIQRAGFDITIESKKLENYYENCLSDKNYIFQV